ncbi:unnamed protein product [Phaeothamnion confervicola]
MAGFMAGFMTRPDSEATIVTVEPQLRPKCWAASFHSVVWLGHPESLRRTTGFCDVRLVNFAPSQGKSLRP